MLALFEIQSQKVRRSMKPSHRKSHVLLAFALAATGAFAPRAHADENLFGFVRGAETLPHGHYDLYQFMTFRGGKHVGTYRGWDFDTELEYGVTDRLQLSAAVVNHYFYNKGVEELPDSNHYRFGGLEVSGKYRILSPFKDPIGLALRVEGGYLLNDEVDGLRQHERYIAPELIFQKNFRDDTVIWELNLGPEWASGKRPAEQYPRELSLQGGTGISWRFAPNWFVGLEGKVRSEFPEMSLYNFEHYAVYAGPSIHYGAERWWVTLSYAYQVYGQEVDATVNGKAYAEEATYQLRLKVGLNF
jgi:hypothetical protein